MALTFNLSINLAGQEHSHSPNAHRYIVARLLDEAKQAVLSSATMRGDCKIVAPNTPSQVVGAWEFTDDNIEA
jgi:hypothetical protein